jgi:group I intron endonuclease
MTRSYVDASKLNIITPMTKKKISDSLKGRKHSIETKIKMIKSRSGLGNHYYGKRLHESTLLAAKKVRGKPIYVYSLKDGTLINNSPFMSIRDTAKYLLINAGTITKKLDTGIPFKGYLYYSKCK